jgi:molybdopterin-guanine dinucleotide biosynthesis protein A
VTARESPTVTAVVLCGGAGRRFGGDKTQALIAGLPLLDHVLLALATPWPVVCVGPQRPTARGVTWCREEPPGGGPVAALAAGLAHVTTGSVVVLGGDMPQAGPAATVLAAALDAQPGVDAVVGTDGDGRRQPLLAAYRLAALRRAMPHPPEGAPFMRLLDGLVVAPLQVDPWVALDVDTPEDLVAARHRLEG